MLTRFILIALLLMSSILAAAVGPETFMTAAGPNANVDWIPAPGPVDVAALGDDARSPAGLTVHEWGTFTSVAGPFGKAIDWMPAGGPTDLPCFVSKSESICIKCGLGASAAQVGGRSSAGKVRMETPVLYFYSPREESVNVRVSFPHGLMTEWYPTNAKVAPENLLEASKNLVNATGTIQWNNVRVMPGATESYPMETGSSHYYAARRTGSAPLEVGNQHEKFLFYRGIASFNPPISAQVTEDGKIAVTNLGEEEIPSVILFENRNGKVGYRIHSGLSNSSEKAAGRSVSFTLPELNGSLEALQRDLEGILRAQGMYALEARAMVDTWRDTWFEQGTRLFYIVPPHSVDSILPLEVSPRPVGVARAFVGRMEVITPATLNEVRIAIVKKDKAAMETYGRFLEPILNALNLSGRISAADRSQATAMMDAIHTDYVSRVSACNRGTNGSRW